MKQELAVKTEHLHGTTLAGKVQMCLVGTESIKQKINFQITLLHFENGKNNLNSNLEPINQLINEPKKTALRKIENLKLVSDMLLINRNTFF